MRPKVLYLREHQSFTPFAPDTLWTTRYVDAAVAQLPGRGPRDPRGGHHPALPPQAPQPEPARPLQLHRLAPPAAGALRPLSDADALELDEDDEGAD